MRTRQCTSCAQAQLAGPMAKSDQWNQCTGTSVEIIVPDTSIWNPARKIIGASN